MPRDVCGVEREIARLAARQDGVVTRRQLLAAGLTRHEVDGRVKRGGLIRPEQLPPSSRARPTRGEFERRMERLTRAAGLPEPISSYRIGGYVADFAWPAQRLIVETDGWATHG